jgi:hypothetical protein
MTMNPQAGGQHKQTTPSPHMKVAGKLRFNKAAVTWWLQELDKTI